MNKVFTLTVIPATRRAKEWLIVSVAPGVPNDMMMKNHFVMEAMAKKRNADLAYVRDVEVKVTPQSWWQRWRSRKATARIRKEFAR